MVKKYRKEDGVSYALGATVAMELINRRRDVLRAVYVSPKSDVKLPPLDVPVIVGDKAFNILSPKENCYVIGEFAKFEAPIRQDGNHIVLVNPSNCGNLGTIMREAAAFGVDLAVIRPAADVFDPKTVRASMGALFDIGFTVFDSFDDYIKEYGDREIVTFMLDGAPFKNLAFESDKKYALVFGNEATGLPAEFKRYNAVRIEQSDLVDSLNISVATAIALYKLYSKPNV